MFEIGDTVRVIGSLETLTIVGIGPGEFFITEAGKDGAARKPFKGSALELVAKAERQQSGPGFVPGRSIMN